MKKFIILILTAAFTFGLTSCTTCGCNKNDKKKDCDYDYNGRPCKERRW